MKKIKSVVFWAGIFTLILATILVKPLDNLDEMWNFNIARCISNGLVPYKDISMITTPFLGFITAVFFKIFGTEMFVTRILAAILAMINIILIYRIFRNLKINNVIAKTSTLVIGLSLLEFFCLDYNFFTITLVLAIILLEIKLQKKHSIYKHLTIGLLAGLSICTKQSIGLLICLVVVLNRFFFIKNKSDLKKCFKEILFRAIGIIIPLSVFVIYLLATNSFSFFIDYNILGIKTFSNKIAYKSLFSSNLFSVKFLAAVVPAFIFVAIVENIYFKVKKNEKKSLYTLTVYSIPTFAIMYPIANNIHFLIASIVPIILIIYGLYKVIRMTPKFKSDNKIYKYLLEFLEIVITLFIALYLAYFQIENMDRLSNLSKYTKLNNFKYIYVDTGMKKRIDEVDNYILSQEKNVYILDSSSAIYMIPINKYNKNYDMFKKGNLGSGGEDLQIEKIKNEDAKYLVLKDEYNLNWQAPTKVISYVKQNLKYTGSIGNFDVYENFEEKQNSNNSDETVSSEENNDNENAEQTVEDIVQTEEVIEQTEEISEQN